MSRGSQYIPMDWRRAIVRDAALSETQTGSALFADISGFTALTETFAKELGPKRGAEEFTVHLNQVFYAIVADLHNYAGSVVSFSGDAITCWFDGDLDGRRAVTCALAMQRTMGNLQEITTYTSHIVRLGIKLAVSIGSVRRFIVGLPEYALMDAMAGRTLERVTAAESMAEKGDVVLDGQTAAQLAEYLTIEEWRTHEESGDQFAVISSLNLKVEPYPWPRFEDAKLNDETIKQWLLPGVYERITTGAGEFLSEIRPTVALFLRFSGIDYDLDPSAPQKLNAFVCHVQKILMRYGGSLLQLTIGDKGSYMYASFGAPLANEDDAERAASAALELVQSTVDFDLDQRLQIGITQGVMWAGAYGGAERKTYGVMGNNVNLAARLMIQAKPGQILMNRGAVQKIESEFQADFLAMVKFKGKSVETEVFELVDRKFTSGFHLFDSSYRVPMVGREDELATISKKIPEVLSGHGQVVGITAEAGMGKSRLAAEVIQKTVDQGIKGFGGEGESFGTNNSYLIWEGIWSDIFKVSPNQPLDQQIGILKAELEAAGSDLLARLPLLSPLLNISIPDNDLTASLDPKAKKSALESLLVDYLRHISMSGPILLLLEDVHWIDDLSKDLLEALTRSIEHIPVMILLVYRPQNQINNRVPDLSGLPYFTEIKIEQFSNEEAAMLIRFKLTQLYSSFKIPQKLVDMVTTKAGGNPFYIEEILNYIRDIDLDIHDAQSLAQVDLPDTIYSLILSRVDRLSHRQQVALRVASVIGRLFRSAMVWGIYPGQKDPEAFEADLKTLTKLEITTVEKPEPELTYLFRHIVTQEVTYESLPFNTRSNLHEQVGAYIEKTYTDNLEQFLDLLAFHYGRSKNDAKKKQYLLQAGDAAKSSFANVAAIDYYNQLLPLLDQEVEKIPVEIKLGEVHDLIGQWEEVEEIYSKLEDRVQAADVVSHLPNILYLLGDLKRRQGKYDESQIYFTKAQEKATRLNDQSQIGKTLLGQGTLNAQQGDFDTALKLYEGSLEIYNELDDNFNKAKVFNNMGVVAEYQGDLEQGKRWYEESLSLRRAIGLQSEVANALSNLGNMSSELGSPDEALIYLEEALVIQRQIGNRWAIANTLNNLGNAARELGQLDRAKEIYSESLGIYKELGDKWALAFLLEDIGSLLTMQNFDRKALFLVGSADKIREEINSPLSEVLKEKLEQKLQSARQRIGEAHSQEVWSAGRNMHVDDAINIAVDQLSLEEEGRPANPDISGAIEFALSIIRDKLEPKYVYHNITHTEFDVMPAAMRLADLSNLPEDEKILLKVAASFHDVGYLQGAAGHEGRSCAAAKMHLPDFGFSQEDIQMICQIIMATQIPQNPVNLAGQILADADLDLLGRTDFPGCSNRLRSEMENLGTKLTDVEWYSQQIAFLENHTYFTDAAWETRHPQKLENVEWLKALVANLVASG
ncbi:MAG: tetratricopeptide repeat protein [Anaerolineae bacterium]